MPVHSHAETSQLIYKASQLTGFYMRATLALNGLNYTAETSETYPFHSCKTITCTYIFLQFFLSIAGVTNFPTLIQ